MSRRAVSTKLSKYRSMRDFGKTPEPSSERAPANAVDRFVIQQHAARRMHYDFRLELDGVLLSWAVPKGPSLSPRERRLAVRTEDHPLDYASFEGIIPKGQYGGGTVSVWDNGTWRPDGDPHEGMRKGRLTFTLHGDKLHGRWHLVRTRPTDKHESWLLFKGRDDAANENLDIVTAEPRSVLSGRTLDEIASAQDRVWQSNRPGERTVYRNVELANAARKRAPHDHAAESQRRAPDEVAALVARLPLGFQLTNLDKVLYPEQGITKAHLIGYLAVVAEWMLPHVANRPLTLVRCPEGRHHPCFFQKKIYPGAPESISTVEVHEDSGEIVDYMKVSDMAGLVGLAQLGTLEVHTWGCHADKLERPDLMVFDLDPGPGVPWDRIALAAFELRRRLHVVGLQSWVKTTGGKGLHVCVPIERRIGWDDFKAFSKRIADGMAADEPASYTSTLTKRARHNKIFVDYLRNGRNATFIAPYSPRARPGAPVAVPLAWEELATGVDPSAFTTATVPKRLAALPADPWRDIARVHQAITAATWKKLGT